jgi:hypothetical protein
MLMRPEQGVKKRRFILFFLILSTIKSFKLNFEALLSTVFSLNPQEKILDCG